MDSQRTIAAKLDSGDRHLDSSGALTADPDAHRDACRRLSGLALTYVVGYALFYFYALAMSYTSQGHGPRPSETVCFAIAASIGLAAYFLGRDARIPPGRFADFVLVFQLVTTLAIVGEMWGFEAHLDEQVRRMWAALGTPGDIQTDFVDRLVAGGTSPFSSRGITGVGIWVMIIPFVVPLSTTRTLVASALSVLMLPGLLLVSAAVHGTPETIRAWTTGLLFDLTMPTAITAAIGVYGSRTFYRVTRELAHAKRMGSYQLVERIGTGGMGEVWRAKHRLLVRPAAIKLIRAEAIGGDGASGTRTALARFEREAQATSALTSPHSIEIYDFGATDDGTFYYVMELLDGLDLRSLVERHGPLPAERVIYLLRQACHSLADAHAHGLVHRDVKPANIFTCRRGLDLDFVKVLDFGLVKHTDESRDHTQLTLEGVASGTPAFMAPEMATGDRPVDGRADLYALGCVAYLLLTGKLVFEGTSGMQVVLRHVRETPAPPSTRTELVIPGALDRLVLELLEKDPARRPQSAQALVERLSACDGIPAWTPERAARWWTTHAPSPHAPAGVPAGASAA